MNQPSAEIEKTSHGANQNAGIWAVGNGLVSTKLVTFFAQSLGAEWGVISWIIAAPKLVGVLRWLAPNILKLGFGYRTTSTLLFFVSSLFLLLLPASVLPHVWPSTSVALTVIVVCWCLYHLAEYCGYVIFVAWLMQWVPPEIRGRFFGHRERWLTAGNLIGFLFAGILSAILKNVFDIDQSWAAYPVLAIYGAIAMAVSVWPLRSIPEPSQVAPPDHSFLDDWRHWSGPRARWFLLYGTWFSAANGLFSTLLFVYPYRALDLSLLIPLAVMAAMRLGQSIISRQVGRTIDQIGWRPVILAGQVLVSVGPILFCLGIWGYVAGNLIWIAYALINVALPIAVVDGNRDRSAAPPLAFYFAWTGLIFGLTALVGSKIADWMVPMTDSYEASNYHLYFTIATLVRLSAIIPLLLLPAASNRRS
ncbi:hypothetical protein GC197_03935 [bacterium]|nr:hypothetical protein [bacterium]